LCVSIKISLDEICVHAVKQTTPKTCLLY